MSNEKKYNRPKYSLEFKQDATKLVLEKGYSQQQAADHLGISQSALGRLVRAERKPSANESAAKKSCLNLGDHDELMLPLGASIATVVSRRWLGITLGAHLIALSQVRSGSDSGAILAGYSYDNAGNQTQRSGGGNLTLGYDALDRLVSASGGGIPTESSRYDHQGRRIETVSNGTPTRFVYAGQDLWSEYGTDWSAAQAHYVHAGLDR